MAFSLSYAEVFRVLTALHEIAPDKELAFRGRLQHFQRLRFPPGVNTGRGKPARYGAFQLMLLAVALEFLQLGMPPDRAVNSIRDDERTLRLALAQTALWRVASEDDAEGFLFLQPNSLGPLSRAEHFRSPISFVPIDHVRAYLEGPRDFAGLRLAMIDLGGLLSAVIRVFDAQLGLAREDEFLNDLAATLLKKASRGDDPKA